MKSHSGPKFTGLVYSCSPITRIAIRRRAAQYSLEINQKLPCRYRKTSVVIRGIRPAWLREAFSIVTPRASTGVLRKHAQSELICLRGHQDVGDSSPILFVPLGELSYRLTNEETLLRLINFSDL